MAQVTVLKDYQVEIPEDARREVPLVAGQQVQVFARNGVITLVPDRPLLALRGFLKGMDIEGTREKKDRV